MNHYDFFALGAAACWAFGSLSSVTPVRHLGPFAFTRTRMLIVASLMWVILLIKGIGPIRADLVWPMAASGLIGIFIGDTALFAAVNRLGPRRAGVLFASHALFSALLAALIFQEYLSGQALAGGGLIVAGVALAILWGKRSQENHHLEADRGHIGLGIALGLLAALCQAGGTLIAKPAMAQGADPLLASCLRMSTAALVHLLFLGSGAKLARAHAPLNLPIFLQTGLNGLVGMGLGMTLILLALRGGDVALVAVLSSITPVLVLPLMWLVMKSPPAPGAWIGAALTVAGTGMVLSR